MPSGIYKHELKYNINKQFLIKQYIKNNKTTYEIAKQFNCSQWTIENRLHKYNIPIQYSNRKYFFITKRFLIKEYIKSKKSADRIANEVNCSHNIIYNRLRKFNILIRKLGSHLKNKKRPEHSEKMKMLMKGNRRIGDWMSSKMGLLCPNYVHGHGNFPYSLEFNTELKEQIRQRDSYTCKKCGIKQKNYYRKLDIHHIDYNKENCNEYNLISLCSKCNNKVNHNRDYWFAYFTYIIKEYIYENTIKN